MRSVSSKRARSYSIALVTSLIASLFLLSGTNATATPTTHSLPVADDYLADFSSASTAGIGLRFSNLPTGYYVDMRLKG